MNNRNYSAAAAATVFERKSKFSWVRVEKVFTENYKLMNVAKGNKGYIFDRFE
jgi:hypothetical protein